MKRALLAALVMLAPAVASAYPYRAGWGWRGDPVRHGYYRPGPRVFVGVAPYPSVPFYGPRVWVPGRWAHFPVPHWVPGHYAD